MSWSSAYLCGEGEGEERGDRNERVGGLGGGVVSLWNASNQRG